MKVIGWNHENPIIEFTDKEFEALKLIALGVDGYLHREIPENSEQGTGINLQKAAALFSNLTLAEKALKRALEQIDIFQDVSNN